MQEYLGEYKYIINLWYAPEVSCLLIMLNMRAIRENNGRQSRKLSRKLQQNPISATEEDY